MTSSYTTNKNIEKPANGDYNNTWSVPVNSDWDIIDRAFGGTTSLNAVGASGVVTLTYTQYQAPIIAITGALTANVNYQLPAGVGGFFYIFNNTSGAFSVLFSSAGGGSTVTLPQGYTVSAISDGTNIGLGTTNAALITSTYADPSWITSLAASKLTGVVPIANGGTNASTAGTALTSLGAAASGTNTDITSLNASAGIQVGSPTLGARGVGTINATGLFVNGVAVGVSGGSVSSVAASGGTTGLTFTGSPITTSGTLTLGGTLAIANGGTGATSGAAALSALGGVTTTGTGATGTWAISISGNAATATNGVVTTSSYADPAWITSLAGSKISGNISGNAATATTATTATTAGNVSGIVAILNGGTGASTAANAFNAIVTSAASLVDPGYIKLQNGLYIIWGTFTAAANGATSVTYPVGVSLSSFSIAVCNGVGEFSTTAQDNFVTVSSCSTSGFSSWNASNSCTTYYIAVGV
jgi:hypothetical protein